MKKYAIYIAPIRGELTESVLLEDGAFTSERNCYREEFGVVLHRPLLFSRRRDANEYASTYGYRGKRFSVHQYTGPTP